MLKIPGSMGVAHIDLGPSKGVLVLIIRWVSYQPGWSRELFVETSVAVLCDFFEIIHPKWVVVSNSFLCSSLPREMIHFD